MADIRMTVVGSYNQILKALASNKLKPDTYVFVKDRDMMAWIDAEGLLHLLGDSVQQIDEFPEKGSKYVLYIKNRTPYIYNGTEFICLVNSERLDYNDLDNQPIINIRGTSDEPVVIADLDDGSYMVKGVFIFGDDRVTSLMGAHIDVETIDGVKYLTKINANQITKLTVNSETSEFIKEEYVTDKYIQEQNFVKSEDLDDKVAELGYIKTEDVKEKVADIVDQTIDKKLIHITRTEINEMFEEE